MGTKWDFRDVSWGIQKIRDFFLGRKFVFHHRFLPVIAPRSIPPPDVPRGPEYKYSNQYYSNRDVLNSVKPPVVAPVAGGFKSGVKRTCSQKKKPPTTGPSLKFPSALPKPGSVWWFDAHCYYKEIEFQPPCGPPSQVPCAPPPQDPCAPPPQDPCAPAPQVPCVPPPCPCPCDAKDERPVVKLDPCADRTPPPEPQPCKVEKVILTRSPNICPPCTEEKPKKKC